MIRKGYQEVSREPLEIPANLLVQPSGGYAVKLCQIGIEQHTLAVQHANDPDNLGRRLGWLGHGASMRSGVDQSQPLIWQVRQDSGAASCNDTGMSRGAASTRQTST